jgi:hypothetical protein
MLRLETRGEPALHNLFDDIHNPMEVCVVD